MSPRESSSTPKKKSPAKNVSKPRAPEILAGNGRLGQNGNVHHLIATRAYELFAQRTTRGPLDDWLDAEREILSQHEAITQ